MPEGDGQARVGDDAPVGDLALLVDHALAVDDALALVVGDLLEKGRVVHGHLLDHRCCCSSRLCHFSHAGCVALLCEARLSD